MQQSGYRRSLKHRSVVRAVESWLIIAAAAVAGWVVLAALLAGWDLIRDGHPTPLGPSRRPSARG